MRGYLGVTSEEVQEFLTSSEIDVAEIYAPSALFKAANSDLDEEEVEFTLSMLAADEALEVKGSENGAACVLAFEIPDALISEELEISITLNAPLKWEYLEALFEVSADGQDLTWFATQEIVSILPELLSK
jgi:hypothetical protein